jgi:hypothetical protein
MAACRRSRDTLVRALLVPEASKKQTREPFLASARQINAPKTTANKYNSTGKSVALSEKSASSYE